MGMKLSSEQSKRFSQCDYEESKKKKVWKTERGPSQDDRACSRVGMPNESSFSRILILILEFREFSRMRAASGFENEFEGILKNPQTLR